MRNQFNLHQLVCLMLAAIVSFAISACGGSTDSPEMIERDATVLNIAQESFDSGDYKAAVDILEDMNKEYGLKAEQEALFDRSLVKYSEQLMADGESAKAVKYLKYVPQTSKSYEDAKKLLEQIESSK